MKIFFVPNYYYIQYELFNGIKNNFDHNVKSYLLYMPNITANDETEVYNEVKFKNDKFSYIKLKQFKLNFFNVKIKILKKFLLYIQLVRNTFRLSRLFNKEKPDACIIGSNLGGPYIRVIQKICFKMNIPVFSYWVNIEFKENANLFYTQTPMWLAKICGVKDILYWDLTEKYIQNIFFLAANRNIKNNLMNEWNIPEKQVFIVGQVVYDEIYENTLRYKSKKNNKNKIVIITEVIHEVFGIEFLKQYISIVANVIKELPDKYEIIIKFHPRETLQTKSIFKKAFDGCLNCVFLEQMKYYELYKNAIFVIGMYSKMLEFALALNVPVLVLNLTNNSKYSIYTHSYTDNRSETKMSTSVNIACANDKDLESNIKKINKRTKLNEERQFFDMSIEQSKDISKLEYKMDVEEEGVVYNELSAKNASEFKEKFHKLLNNDAFYEKAKDIVKRWVSQNIFTLDGKNAQYAAKTILSIVENKN